MVHSRKALHNIVEVGPSSAWMIELVKKDCQAYEENYYLVKSNENVKSKTMFIRYEDLALNVMKRISESMHREIQSVIESRPRLARGSLNRVFHWQAASDMMVLGRSNGPYDL